MDTRVWKRSIAASRAAVVLGAGEAFVVSMSEDYASPARVSRGSQNTFEATSAMMPPRTTSRVMATAMAKMMR